jgi:O-methyltransferase involved in polyketide biosynthesis
MTRTLEYARIVGAAAIVALGLFTYLDADRHATTLDAIAERQAERIKEPCK